MATSIGDFIRDSREAKKLRQEDLAQQTRTSPTTVSNWERGITAPGLDDLTPLAVALSVSPVLLLEAMGLTIPVPDEARLPSELTRAYLKLSAGRRVHLVEHALSLVLLEGVRGDR